MGRPQLIVLVSLLALPLAGLALLLATPSADVHWEHHPAHFWLVLITAGLNAALAYATGVAARQRGDRRVHLVSLAFLAASGFLALHALSTPGVLLDRSNLGFVIATPIGLVLASVFAALSALDVDPVRPALLQRLLLVSFGAWLVVSLAFFPDLADSAVPERLSWPLVVLSVLGVGLFAFAVGRYAVLYRQRPSTLLLAFAVAFVLLAEALVAIAISRNWRASWWEWHVLMLLAFAVIAWAAHREWHEERFSPLYRPETAAATRTVSVLFADLKGFTAYSEQHEAGAVTEMLNTYFEAAIPALEEHGAEIDRLIGDAVFATFDGNGHAERAGRAALALQAAVEAVAAAHPGWPRFRVGVHTGEATVGVLGSGSGRTYSVIGDTVNLGARIEGLAPVGGVAISAETARGLAGAKTERLGTVEVKGRDRAGRGAPPARAAAASVIPGWSEGESFCGREADAFRGVRASRIRECGCGTCATRSAAGLSDPDAQHFRRPHRRAALLAGDGESRREGRRAFRAAVAGLAPALRADGGQFRLELEEVALHGAAAEAEGDPVAECLAALLLDPVPPGLRARLLHGPNRIGARPN